MQEIVDWRNIPNSQKLGNKCEEGHTNNQFVSQECLTRSCSVIRCLRIYWCLGVASAAGLQKPDAVHRTKIMEEREELPPANSIKREI